VYDEEELLGSLYGELEAAAYVSRENRVVKYKAKKRIREFIESIMLE
jgi:hypothetical protein